MFCSSKYEIHVFVVCTVSEPKGRFTPEAGAESQAGVENRFQLFLIGSLHIARVQCAYGVSGYEADVYE